MKARYGIYNTESKTWFSGFDASGHQRWGDENHSKPYDNKVLAETQATIFGVENTSNFHKAEVLRAFGGAKANSTRSTGGFSPIED